MGEVSLYSITLLTVTSILLSAVFYFANQNNLLTRFFRFILVFSYVCLLFFVLFKSLLFDFTGSGFEDEVYYHLSWESFKIAFNEYSWQLSLLFVLIIGYFFLAEHLVPPTKRSFNRLAVLSLTGLYAGALLLAPIGEFFRGYYTYINNSTNITIDSQTVKPFIDAGFLNNIDIQPKNLISASTQDKKNLILIYLESFNQFLVDDPEFKSLTPNMNQLGEGFHHFKHENSAFVTIEGIVSSQCGTLLTMSSGNDSFMKKSDAMSELPCLGDVLKTAEYEQYFLGGAKMEFAGKGDFLNTHGYDHVWGMEHWRAQGKKANTNIWGLSDTELFQEALNIIRKATKTPPYNLTLLTLGTHIPGYVYPGCEAIKTDNRFLASIACTDLLLGQFIDTLKAENLLNNTLLVIVADHGVFPNPKMTKIFGNRVKDRRLVGITNHDIKESNLAIASYDLAPTILDWLNVKHTAQFLFGKTQKDHAGQTHHHVSRYSDWHNGELVNTQNGECRVKFNGKTPLNTCEKENLKSISKQVLQKFSRPEKGVKLACELTMQANLSEPAKTIMLNQENQYQNFHYSGYGLDTRQYDTGHFIFEIDKNLRLINLQYYKLNDAMDNQPIFQWSDINTKTKQVIEIIASKKDNLLKQNIFQHTLKNSKELVPMDDVFKINLCEN